MPRCEDYRLRPMEEADLAKVLEWRNSERVRANMFTDQIISREEHLAWFARLKQDISAICKIFENQLRPVGVVNVRNIDIYSSRCLWGFYLGEAGAPPGSGLVMGYLALNYIFGELGMRKLCGEVLAFNLPSINLHRKLGFVEEGRFVQHLCKNGRYEDVISLALFNKDWMNLRGRIRALCFGEENL